MPNDPSWHFELADCLVAQGNKNDAITHFNRGMSGRFSAKAYLRAASFLRHEKRYSDATRVVQEAIRKKPWSGEPYQNLASIYSAQKDYKNAEAELKKVLSIDKYADTAYSDLGRIYVQQNEFENARDLYKQAVAKCPKNLVLLRRLGDMEAKLKNDDAARQCYEKVIALVPNSVGLNILVQNEIALAHAKLGSRYYADHQPEKALQSAKLFNHFKFAPVLPPLLTLVHLRPGRLEPAQTATEQEFQNHIMLADMLREGGRLDDCIAEYRKAEALNSDDIDVHSFLLNVLDEKGDLLETAREDVILSSKLVNRVPAEIKRLTNGKPANKLAPTTESPQVRD